MPITSIGRIMAERTAQSWTTVPHFFVSREIDVSALKTARDAMVPKIEELHGVKMTHTDLIVAAVARALRKHPRMNASWENGRITLHQDVNVGLAIAVETPWSQRSCTTPTKASIGDIAKQRIDKAQKARAGRLAPADISGATFTISNLGMFNVDYLHGDHRAAAGRHSRRWRHRRSRGRGRRHARSEADDDRNAVVGSPGHRRRQRGAVPQ
jgi:pyruvate dehydrogenase E2 component (dihydrolipoamide acetyltransferase)